MTKPTGFPTRMQAEALLAEAEARNPGPWTAHSRVSALGAAALAARHPDLDEDTAYTAGLLHDIGRRAGVTAMRHVLDGYLYLNELGFPGAARISLTHSFPIQDLACGAGHWDCTAEEMAFTAQALRGLEYDVYDRLIQLIDAVALPAGCCIMEKRMVDVALRHGFNAWTLNKWRAYFDLQSRFESELGCSIYSLLPDVSATSFAARSA